MDLDTVNFREGDGDSVVPVLICLEMLMGDFDGLSIMAAGELDEVMPMWVW